MVDSKAQIMGHPIHPMLVMFPVALFPVALIFDLVWLWQRDALWLSASFWTLLLGVVFTAIAMVPGLIDYFSVVPSSGPARRVGTLHLITGTTIFVLALVGLALRWFGGAYTFSATGASPNLAWTYWAIGLNAVVNLALIAQGWWGGELVYKHRIGVSPRGPAVEGERARDRDRGRARYGGGRE